MRLSGAERGLRLRSAPFLYLEQPVATQPAYTCTWRWSVALQSQAESAGIPR